MEYILQLAEYKVKNSKVESIKHKKIESIIISCIKGKKACFYKPKIEFQDEKDIFIIYSSQPLYLANDITNAIFEFFNKYVSLSTQLVNKEFVINIDNYNYIYIYLYLPINKYIAYNLPDNFIYSMTFKRLYSIQWFYKIDDEEIDKMINQCKKKLTNGGLAVPKTTRVETKKRVIESIYNELISNVSIQNEIALLSYYQEILEDKAIDFHKTLDFIYMSEEAYCEIINIIKTICKQEDDYILQIYYHKHFYIPNDFRLKKVSIYLESNDKYKDKIYLCNLYNCGTYEVLPILKSNQLLPSKYVCLRFLYLDMFFLEHETVNKSYINQRVSFMLNLKESKDNIIWKGIYRNEKVDKINTNLNCEKDLNIYRPWIYFNTHKTLRNLSKK